MIDNNMKKSNKIILLVLGIIVVVYIVLYSLAVRGVIPINIIPGISIIIPETDSARTLYRGYVNIEPVSLSDLKTKLEKQGCRYGRNDHKSEATGQCRYEETLISDDNKNGVQIYPLGFGVWGPSSFSLTEDKLWATKDIPGLPNPDKFKEEVRQDVSAIGNIVQIKENSWTITKTKYPWTVSY